MRISNGWSVSGESNQGMVMPCGAVIVSKDTNVTMILALAQCIRGQGVVHVLGETVVEIDTLVNTLAGKGVDFRTLGSVYVVAGCDFTAGTYGVTHEHYVRAAIRHRHIIGGIDENTPPITFELLTILAYLEKHGFSKLLTFDEKEALRKSWSDMFSDTNEVRRRLRTVFASEYDQCSSDWILDVRRLMADLAKSAAELVPPSQHISLQAKRVKFVVFQYWSHSSDECLTSEILWGCDENSGFTDAGHVLLERKEDIKSITTEMNRLVAKCGCKENATTENVLV